MRAILALLLGLSGVNALCAELPPCAKPVRYAAEWFPAPEIDHTRSSAQVTSIGASAKGQGKGLQIGHVVVETKLGVHPQDSCTGVVVRLGFIKPVLRVASEIPEGSCAYARVLNHENTHVRIYRDIAERFRRLEYPWPDRAKPAAILAHAQQELARLMRAQQEFDSADEYAKNQTVCGGEILRLVKLPSQPATGSKRS
ncbi:MAG TPA: hypothetical protein VLA16_09980 [Ideonella sp.]|nr:hypothetical protein [Ideonella sp.]